MVSTRVDATSKLKQADAAVAAARKVIAQHGAKTFRRACPSESPARQNGQGKHQGRQGSSTESAG